MNLPVRTLELKIHSAFPGDQGTGTRGPCVSHHGVYIYEIVFRDLLLCIATLQRSS